MKTDLQCPHYEGDGMYFEFSDYDLSVCDNCWAKMKVKVLEQLKCEAMLDEFVNTGNSEAKDE